LLQCRHAVGIKVERFPARAHPVRETGKLGVIRPPLGVVNPPRRLNEPAGRQHAVTGDFNSDGKSDNLWRNSNGDASIWFMNGTSVSSVSDLGLVPTSWVVQRGRGRPGFRRQVRYARAGPSRRALRRRIAGS
jgi:hypothetical protein